MAEQKRKEPTFYRVLHRTDKFNPGEHIELERSVEFDRWNVDRSDLAELVKLPLQELQAKRKDGATAEKTIFGKVQVAAEEWVEQAAQTMLLDRAIEYVKTPEVKHTSNEWKRQKDGVWEISNRVYIMRYKIMQETTGNHQGQWLVTWGIAINRPPRPSTEKYYYSGDVMVVEMEQNKEHAFDAFCKRVVKNEAVNIQLEYSRQEQQEVVFSDLTPEERRQLQYIDTYAPERRVFRLFGMDMEISDGNLGRALDAVSKERRDIVLLAYLLGMTDVEIAKRLGLNRSTVQYRRTSTLEQLRKIMEENGYEYHKQ